MYQIPFPILLNDYLNAPHIQHGRCVHNDIINIIIGTSAILTLKIELLVERFLMGTFNALV